MRDLASIKRALILLVGAFSLPWLPVPSLHAQSAAIQVFQAQNGFALSVDTAGDPSGGESLANEEGESGSVLYSIQGPTGETMDLRFSASSAALTMRVNSSTSVRYLPDAQGGIGVMGMEITQNGQTVYVPGLTSSSALSSEQASALSSLRQALVSSHSPEFLAGVAAMSIELRDYVLQPGDQLDRLGFRFWASCGISVVGWVASLVALPAECATVVGCPVAVVLHELASASVLLSCSY